MVKRLPTMQETWARSLDWEDPLEKEMAIHSSTLAWKIPWLEEPNRLQSMGSQRVRHDRATSLHYIYIYTHIYKYNGIPLIHKNNFAATRMDLETIILSEVSPKKHKYDREAWHAAIHGSQRVGHT